MSSEISDISDVWPGWRRVAVLATFYLICFVPSYVLTSVVLIGFGDDALSAHMSFDWLRGGIACLLALTFFDLLRRRFRFWSKI